MDGNSAISIVGGSLVGPTMALLLDRNGFENVTIYESVPQTVSQAGGIIGLDHNSLSIFESLGIAQHELVDFPSERVLRTFVQSGETDVSLFPGRNTTWTLAHNALMEKLASSNVKFVSRKRVTDVENDALGFADGSTAHSDFTIFADGRKSIGRKLLDPTRPLKYMGYIAFRGLSQYCPPDVRDWIAWQSRNARIGAFPVRLPNDKIGMDWTMYLNVTETAFRRVSGVSPTVRTFMLPYQITDEIVEKTNHAARRLFPKFVADLVVSTLPGNRMAAPIVDINKPTKMEFGNSVLLGDALAPVRPHTGRGANNGIDQANGLAIALDQVVRYGADLTSALKGWEIRHLPFVEYTLQRGRQMAKNIGLGTM